MIMAANTGVLGRIWISPQFCAEQNRNIEKKTESMWGTLDFADTELQPREGRLIQQIFK